MVRPRIELIALRERAEIARFTVEPGSYTMGRSSACSLQLKAEGISREHARIELTTDGTVLLEDLGSANGITGTDSWGSCLYSLPSGRARSRGSHCNILAGIQILLGASSAGAISLKVETRFLRG